MKLIALRRLVLKYLTLPVLFVVCSLFIPLPGSAAVTGVCSNCHTMHNSQNGGQVARGGSGVGWGGGGQLTGGSSSGPNDRLLVTSCVGCHSSTTTSTIINLGSNRIPIVYNTVLPTTPLAGGNFYWVSQGGAANDAKGHNVYGISAADSTLKEAPGRMSVTCSNATSCHTTLAAEKDTEVVIGYPGGCQGCHTQTAHHDDSKPWYRFLKGHMDTVDYVTGIEDPNWEQNPTPLVHNKYQGYAGPVSSFDVPLSDTHSMSSFCGGCHGRFHKGNYIGSSSPWLRHPTDILLPNAGEYSGYDPVTNYSVEAPVAWVNPSAPARSEAVVMCLSCHRAHGSDQPDMLRWNYSTIIAGGGGSGGCFTCHTNKN